jgi:hypothetical protein
MTSGLWVAAAGMVLDDVRAAIPPPCRRTVDEAGARRHIEHGELIAEGPIWAASDATEFVPAFCSLTHTPYDVRLELAVRVGGAWSGWAAGAALGSDAFAPLPAAPPLDVDIDVFRASRPVEAVRVRARVRPPAPLASSPWMLSLSASQHPPSPLPPTVAGAARLSVIPLSQMESDPALARRICSPTCVAMVLAYWDRPVSPGTLATQMFHRASDLYGVWPAAIVAAGRHGLAGYLLRFPDWAAAVWCLEHGLPIIASVRYARGELTGAAIDETAGHLVVLTGVDGEDALVNDPAAPHAGAVARRYRVAELARVWLERTGMGYVLFRVGGGRLRGG